MTVTKCQLQRNMVRYTSDARGQDRVQASYLIETDDPDQGGFSVRDQAQAYAPSGTARHQLPSDWETFNLLGDTNANLYAQQINLRQTQVRTQWLAEVTWQPLQPGEQPDDAQTDPLLRPAKVWVEDGLETEQIWQAYNEQELPALDRAAVRAVGTLGPIENAARRQLELPLTSNRRFSILCIQWNQTNRLWGLQLNQAYDRTTNQEIEAGGNVRNLFGITPKHCCRYLGCRLSDPQTERGTEYYVTTVRLELRREPYYQHVVNRGYDAWNANAGEVRAIMLTDDNGDPIPPAEPPLLTADGRQLTTGVGNSIPYRVEKEVDYTYFENLIDYVYSSP